MARGAHRRVCQAWASARSALPAIERLALPLLGDPFGHVSMALLAEAGNAIVTL